MITRWRVLGFFIDGGGHGMPPSRRCPHRERATTRIDSSFRHPQVSRRLRLIWTREGDVRAGEMGKRVSIVGPTEALSCRPLVGESDSDLHFHPVRPEGFEPPTLGLEVRRRRFFIASRRCSQLCIFPGGWLYFGASPPSMFTVVFIVACPTR